MPGPAKTVTLKLYADSAEAQRKLDDIYAKAEELGRLNPEIKPKIDKAAATAGLAVLRKELKDTQSEADKLSGSAGKLATSAEGLGTSATSAGSGLGSMGGGMGVAVAAGVALSPVLVTLGVGLAGFGAAAVGVIAPIEKAASKTGGLQKNMHLLNPEQQAVARSLLGLGKQYQQFQNSLQPEVLATFGTGLHLVSGLMRDVQPVAKATGIAVDGLLGRVDAEFRSGTWQSFFGWMAKNVGPDMKLVGDSLINLTDTLPPLLRDLQPVATTLLELTAATTKGIDITAQLSQQLATVGGATKSTNPLLHVLGEAVKYNTLATTPWVSALIMAKRELDFVSGASDKSKQALAGWARTGGAGALAAHGITTALNGMNAAVTTSISRVLTLEGDQVSWKQSQQAATTAINANHKALDGNSASALAARAAIVQATGSVLKFADEQNTSTGSLHRASAAVQDQIAWLVRHAGKSKIARDEIHALREEEAKIKREIDQRIVMQGSGHYSISPSTGFSNPTNNPIGKLAAGWKVPGYGGGDRWPALLEGGEAVVPKQLTPAIAPFLAAHGVPGFAAGGLAGSYSGNIPGLTRFAAGMDKAFQTAMLRSMVGSMHGAIRQAASMFAGPTGGSTGPGALAAQSWMRAHMGDYGWGASQFPALQALWNHESGWRWNAQNPTSPAYGIPQSDPGSKMAVAGADWRTNPVTQMRWGAEYIRGTYGNPANAWAFEMSHTPNWYDHGGYLPTGLSMAYNGTGRPEPVGPAAGTTVNITLNVRTAVGQQPGEVGRQIADYLGHYLKNGGHLYPRGTTPR